MQGTLVNLCYTMENHAIATMMTLGPRTTDWELKLTGGGMISKNRLESPLDRTLSGATTWARVDLEAMAMKGYSTFPKAPLLLESCHQIV